jgi:hypothetical protein
MPTAHYGDPSLVAEIGDQADSKEQFAACDGGFMSLFVLFCAAHNQRLRVARGTLLIR